MATEKVTRRNDPKRARSSESRYTLMDFEREFTDDTACMDFLVRKLYPEGVFCPKCDKVTKHHRIKKRTAYGCQFCGHQEYPLKGTIFEGSSTSLRLWFYAIYLMASTRCGISAKQLERELGVSYPTAWRMFKQIRSMLFQDDEPMGGTVEVDEAYIGGRRHWMKNARKAEVPKGGHGPKVPVVGMAQRKSEDAPAKINAKVVPVTSGPVLIPHVRTRVLPATIVYTDEFTPYNELGRHGVTHKRVKHSANVYVDGDVHTNTVENFWSHLKRGISGVYHGVSTQHLQSYVDEYVFRYNNREITGKRGMFDAFLSRIEKA
jgi:transposase-like protein